MISSNADRFPYPSLKDISLTYLFRFNIEKPVEKSREEKHSRLLHWFQPAQPSHALGVIPLFADCRCAAHHTRIAFTNRIEHSVFSIKRRPILPHLSLHPSLSAPKPTATKTKWAALTPTNHGMTATSPPQGRCSRRPANRNCFSKKRSITRSWRGRKGFSGEG